MERKQSVGVWRCWGLPGMLFIASQLFAALSSQSLVGGSEDFLSWILEGSRVNEVTDETDCSGSAKTGNHPLRIDNKISSDNNWKMIMNFCSILKVSFKK